MSPYSHRTQLLGFMGWMTLTFAVAAVGAFASIEARAFYAQLIRPAWAPPGYVFGPVWSVLYTMMGISAWLVWRERGAKNWALALTLFVVQLGINALWSWLFFAWHKGAWAFADVVLLAVLIAVTMAAFGSIRRLAAWLMLPYLCWVSFASLLTWAMWQGNLGAL
jgi:translocator protein